MILQTLFQQAVRNHVQYFNEYFIVDLLINEGQACGVVALCLRDGTLHVFHARAVILATGGYGRAWQVTSNALACTGDGMAVAYRRGIPLEDMEMYQFHPTGLYGIGILFSEAARGEGGYLLGRPAGGDDAWFVDVDGQPHERFCRRYAPTLEHPELDTRDKISRHILREIAAGRGIGGKDYVYLDVRHLGEKIEAKLGDTPEFARTYLRIEPHTQPVPIYPTAHYAMGGVPTDIDGRVVLDEQNTPLPGLYAAGEVACVSVHGANRLGTNSLVDLIVFGRRAGKHIAATWLPEADFAPLPAEPEAFAAEHIEHLLYRGADRGETADTIRTQLRAMMWEKVGIIRDERKLTAARDTLVELKARYEAVRLMDTSRTFNTELMEVLELGMLLDCCEASIAGALARQESRGGHYREDYPEHDDAHFLKHTLAFRTEPPGAPELRYKPVVITKFSPKDYSY
jgi:succinate dehydrogenase / fumarate reductase flavoprotein subunit